VFIMWRIVDWEVQIVMQKLKERLRKLAEEDQSLPFSIYCSIEDQLLLNVPILKPLLICVLDGKKELQSDTTSVCNSGDFIFLANTPKIDMRNISLGEEYFALLIEFDYQDFSIFEYQAGQSQDYFNGQVDDALMITLSQFIDWAPSVPQTMWQHRRKEILQLLYHSGYKQVRHIVEPPSLTHRVEQFINANKQNDLGLENVASSLAMSESTLRRKLSQENTNFQSIKDRVKLGYGLHLLQSTATSIGIIAEQCGYQSQSRFTDKFKSLFGLTPSELRKTKIKN